ncbi:Glycosyl phosphatidyl inositol anchor synthesis [Thoreauomyces humboldtii]|nr:Glycosyl phosphatidyl inositol anchor synthesis [Thoreauomyces humboldtii]
MAGHTQTHPPSLAYAVARLISLGVVFHAIYSWSIFDIYFRSPLVHGMTPIKPSLEAPAQRLLLFVADGLRADKLFENRMSGAPFLRDAVLTSGSWGVSHTRVPTESRPGHVALIAGFYEDVSAVTKGWKMNPVNFDSVFNQSFHTWSFGSPDILPMFSEGASDPRSVETIMYPQESEDFADDASKLDIWVFEKFDALFETAKQDSNLDSLLRKPGIVFFLHLLGLDTNGHAHRPYSREYLENIELVDRGVKAATETLERFYNHDGRTSYIFTADHGMSNQGNHGDGNPDNTRTPLIAWGAGIARAKINSGLINYVDAYTSAWGLTTTPRIDVEQADIAPLMSTLLGVPYPVNSVGVLPLAYLAGSEGYKARSAFENAQQILAQYRVKSEMKRRTEPFFRAFQPLHDDEQFLRMIDDEIVDGHYLNAIESSQQLIRLCLQGLRYYQTYDWLFLRSIVSLGYLGWVSYSTLFILRGGIVPLSSTYQKAVEAQKSSNILTIALGTAGFAASSLFLHYKESPPMYYAYLFFPFFFWTMCLGQSKFVLTLLKSITRDRDRLVSTGASIVFYVAALEILVYSYFCREVLSPCLWVLGLLWPRTFSQDLRAKHYTLLRVWAVMCLSTSVFPFLSAEKHENALLVGLGGAAIVASGIFALTTIANYTTSELPKSAGSVTTSSSGGLLAFETVVALVSTLTTIDTTLRLRAKTGLPLLNQGIAWCVLGVAILIPILDGGRRGQHYLRRLVVIYLAFAPVFVFLTISYEALFYFSFSGLIATWLLLERVIHSETRADVPGTDSTATSAVASRLPRNLELSDLRVTAIFLLLSNVAFFGTGNLASVASFSLSSVYRFTTVFDPFIMGALLILKILIPFFLLSAVLAVLARALALPAFALFLLVLATTDVMTLNFFFLVKDHGSWLEIGSTISHFVIASAFIVFQCLLFAASWALVGGVLVPDLETRRWKKRH